MRFIFIDVASAVSQLDHLARVGLFRMRWMQAVDLVQYNAASTVGGWFAEVA